MTKTSCKISWFGCICQCIVMQNAVMGMAGSVKKNRCIFPSPPRADQMPGTPQEHASINRAKPVELPAAQCMETLILAGTLQTRATQEQAQTGRVRRERLQHRRRSQAGRRPRKLWMWDAPSQISSANSKAREPAIHSLQVSRISAWKGLTVRACPAMRAPSVGTCQNMISSCGV